MITIFLILKKGLTLERKNHVFMYPTVVTNKKTIKVI